MKTHILIAIVSFGPALILIGCALWSCYAKPESIDDFLADLDDWGQP